MNPDRRRDKRRDSTRNQTVALAVSGAFPRRWFRIVALLLPILCLLGLEVFLRLAGYGYPTGFVLRQAHSGTVVLRENPKFGWRFFPPKIARSPLPFSAVIPKPPGTCRIIVLGESAAMGDPEPSYGLARQLEKMLQARHPERKIEVLNFAMTAINSYVIREIARNCEELNADAWVVYAGNNEVIGPFGAGTVFGRQAPSLARVRAELAAKQTRIGQLLGTFAKKAKADSGEWQGMELFLQHQVRRNDPRMTRVYESFAANLKAILELGKSAAAKVVVATVAVNLTDCPPFSSLHRAGLTVQQLAAWGQVYTAGSKAQQDHLPAQALKAYQAASELDPEYAELAYRMAECYAALNDKTNAHRYYQLARDLDTLRFRLDSRMNASVRQVTQSSRAILVDLEEQLASGSDSELFYDHVHFSFEGNHAASSSILRSLEPALFGYSAPAPPSALSETAAQLAFTPFDRHRILEEMRQRLLQPPFTCQSHAAERDAALKETLGRLKPQPRESIATYEQAIALGPPNWTLHANFARLLEAGDDFQRAKAEWLKVTELSPQIPDAWFHLGTLAAAAHAPEEAVADFRKALELNPYSTEALNSLGLAYSNQGRSQEALKAYEDALKINPRFSAARVNLGREMSRAGQLQAAELQYRNVLAADTNNIAARVNLGKLLIGQGNAPAAIALFKEALRIDPDNPIAHFDLGNAFAQKGDYQGALAHYEAAVRAQPSFVEARYSLALQLARVGRVEEALAHFAEVLREQPENVDARFNYGIALAKQKQLSAAADQFAEVLRIRPDHSQAKAALEKTRALETVAPR